MTCPIPECKDGWIRATALSPDAAVWNRCQNPAHDTPVAEKPKKAVREYGDEGRVIQ